MVKIMTIVTMVIIREIIVVPYCALLSNNQQIALENVFTIEINTTAKTVEVVRFVNIKDKKGHAKTVEVVVYAYIRDKEITAKTVEVLVYANIKDKEVNAKTVEVVRYANIKDKEVNAKTVEVIDLILRW
jgi:SH3-like domain-containing protein